MSTERVTLKRDPDGGWNVLADGYFWGNYPTKRDAERWVEVARQRIRDNDTRPLPRPHLMPQDEEPPLPRMRAPHRRRRRVLPLRRARGASEAGGIQAGAGNMKSLADDTPRQSITTTMSTPLDDLKQRFVASWEDAERGMTLEAGLRELPGGRDRAEFAEFAALYFEMGDRVASEEPCPDAARIMARVNAALAGPRCRCGGHKEPHRDLCLGCNSDLAAAERRAEGE